jgi:hypothetical protein
MNTWEKYFLITFLLFIISGLLIGYASQDACGTQMCTSIDTDELKEAPTPSELQPITLSQEHIRTEIGALSGLQIASIYSGDPKFRCHGAEISVKSYGVIAYRSTPVVFTLDSIESDTVFCAVSINNTQRQFIITTS